MGVQSEGERNRKGDNHPRPSSPVISTAGATKDSSLGCLFTDSSPLTEGCLPRPELPVPILLQAERAHPEEEQNVHTFGGARAQLPGCSWNHQRVVGRGMRCRKQPPQFPQPSPTHPSTRDPQGDLIQI